MSRATPHRGVEPGVRPKTVVMGFTRVVVECLLALAELASGETTAVEGMNVNKVGKATVFIILVLSIFSSERGDLH